MCWAFSGRTVVGNRNKDRLDKLNKVLSPDAKAEEGATSAQSPSGVRSLLNRDTALSKIASGKQRTVQHLMHAPERIRMWINHNRNYDLLSVERCADLIEGFTRTGSQEFPAVVRRVTDDKSFDFEIICGARRHWTAAHLGWPLLIEVRELTDRQAFILQDLENRDREDISDYERAIDYKNALPKFFENNRASMAQFLEIDKSNFHRLLELAELPKSIVSAYADLRELKVHHGTAYRKLLADEKAKRKLLDAARQLREESLSGSKLFSALKKAAQTGRKKPESPTERSYGTVNAVRIGKHPIVQLTLRVSTTDYSVVTPNVANELRKDFESFMRDLESGEI